MEEKDFIKLEAKIIRQEHRLIPLIQNFRNRNKKWPNDDDPRKEAASKAILWRLFFSPSVISIVLSGGILGWFTLYFLRNQNQLIADQNDKIEIQSNLMEVNRRASQMFVMGEVLSDLNKEIEDKNKIDDRISNTLSGRIDGLSRAMKPYRYYQNNELTEKMISPERGQLLIALVASKMDTAQLSDILVTADFSYADLKKVWFKNTSLPLIDLSSANLENVHFNRISLLKSDLSFANVKNADFYNVDIRETTFEGVDLSLADTFEKSRVSSKDWFDEMEEEGAIGVQALRQEYRIDLLYNSFYKKRSVLPIKKR